MGNQITKFTKYLTLLDEVYKKESVTSVLDTDDSLVQEGSNAHTLKIPKITLDGLADYSRSGGYVGGDANLSFEEKSFNYERGRKFTVDAVDDIDTVGLMSANIMATFLREKVVPEVDAFRFAKYCSLASTGNKVAETITAANVIEKITDGVSKLDDAEVQEEDRFLFVTPAIKRMIDNLDTTKSRAILDDFEDRIYTVPQSRFQTAIDLVGTGAGGYTSHVATESGDYNGANINFMIVGKSALIQFAKHVVNKVVAPEENQTSDGWMFFYRENGIAEAKDNKKASIYVSHVTPTTYSAS